MTKIAVFPGTFDPITLGHQDLINRASQIFTKVIVAVASNANKNPLFSLEKRVSMIKKAFNGLSNIEVVGFNNLLVDFLSDNNASIIIRGVRVVTDFEYELQLANMNRSLAPDIETVFLTPSEQYSCISSTLVKEAANLGGDVSSFVNQDVVIALSDKRCL